MSDPEGDRRTDIWAPRISPPAPNRSLLFFNGLGVAKRAVRGVFRGTHVMGHFMTRQFALFLLIGGGAAGLHWLARVVIDVFTGYLVALVLAYAVGISAGYILNALFVFSSNRERRAREILLFTSFNLSMLPVVLGVSWTLSELVFPTIPLTWHAREIAHAIGVITPVFANFLFHKFVTFGETSIRSQQ